MEQTIISVVIVIICIVLIYGIISYKYNRKLIKTLESFQNTYQLKNVSSLSNGLINNLQFTTEYANGTWTYLTSTVNSDYIMNITINQTQQSNTTDNYGTITVTDTTSNNNVILNLTITSIGNGMLTASVQSSDNSDPTAITPTGMPITNIFIQFVNSMNSDMIKEIQKQVYYTSEAPIAIVSLFNGNILVSKYASYKVFNNTVGSNLYGILLSNSFYVDNPVPIYDYTAYNKITTNYQYPSNYITFNFGTVNSSVQTTLQNNYFGQIQFAIQRVFQSPTGNQITTSLSSPLLISALQGSNIPESIQIVPLSADQQANNLNSFFQPISTIVYFYKFQSVDTTYGYNNNNLITVPSSVMNFKNQSKKMFNSNIQYNDLTSVYQNNDYIFNIQYLTTVNSNMNDPTIIPFTTLIPLL